MLTVEDIKEQLSYAYVHAVAAKAGFSCDRPSVDRDSVDAEISAKGFLDPGTVLSSPKVQLQLKATARGPVKEALFGFRLKRKNHDDLRRRTMCPRLLVVLVLPMHEKHWLAQTEQSLITRYCAYWHNLLNVEEPSQQSLVPLAIRKGNRFTVNALKQFLVLASKREDIGHEF